MVPKQTEQSGQCQNYKIVKLTRDLWKLLKDKPSAQSKVNWSRLPRTLSSWVLSISKHGNVTASLGNLFQCLATPNIK